MKAVCVLPSDIYHLTRIQNHLLAVSVTASNQKFKSYFKVSFALYFWNHFQKKNTFAVDRQRQDATISFVKSNLCNLNERNKRKIVNTIMQQMNI